MASSSNALPNVNTSAQSTRETPIPTPEQQLRAERRRANVNRLSSTNLVRESNPVRGDIVEHKTITPTRQVIVSSSSEPINVEEEEETVKFHLPITVLDAITLLSCVEEYKPYMTDGTDEDKWAQVLESLHANAQLLTMDVEEIKEIVSNIREQITLYHVKFTFEGPHGLKSSPEHKKLFRSMVITICQDWDDYEVKIESEVKEKRKRKIEEDSEPSSSMTENPRKRREVSDVTMLDVPTLIVSPSTDVDAVKAACNDIRLYKIFHENARHDDQSVFPEENPPWLTKLNKAKYTTVGSLGGWQNFDRQNLKKRLVEILGGNIKKLQRGVSYWEKALENMQKWTNEDMLAILQSNGSEITLEDLNRLRPEHPVEVNTTDSNADKGSLEREHSENNNIVVIDDEDTNNELEEIHTKSLSSTNNDASMADVSTLSPPDGVQSTDNGIGMQETQQLINLSEEDAEVSNNITQIPHESNVESHTEYREPQEILEKKKVLKEYCRNLLQQNKLLEENNELLKKQSLESREAFSVERQLLLQQNKLLEESNELLKKQSSESREAFLVTTKVNERYGRVLEELLASTNERGKENNNEFRHINGQIRDLQKVVADMYQLFKNVSPDE